MKIPTVVQFQGLADDFSRYFNTQFLASDIVNKIGQVYSGQNVSNIETLVLPGANKMEYSVLKESGYSELISRIITNLRIEDSCMDILISELEPNQVKFLNARILFDRKHAHVQEDDANSMFLIHSSNFLIDLLLRPFSHFHSEVLIHLDYFTKMLEAVGGDPNQLFLNARSATAFSQYLQIYVAESLNIAIRV
jgi:hypothetical protein